MQSSSTLFSQNESNGLPLSWASSTRFGLPVFMERVSKDVKVQLWVRHPSRQLLSKEIYSSGRNTKCLCDRLKQNKTKQKTTHPKQKRFSRPRKQVVKTNVNWVYVRCAVLILSPCDLSSLQNTGQRQMVPGYQVVCFTQVILAHSWHAFPPALQHHAAHADPKTGTSSPTSLPSLSFHRHCQTSHDLRKLPTGVISDAHSLGYTDRTKHTPSPPAWAWIIIQKLHLYTLG